MTEMIPAGLPTGVRRSAADLRQLVHDARHQARADLRDVRIPWCDPAGVPTAAAGIEDTATWLLGEREVAPLLGAVYSYPQLPLRAVRTAAVDAIEHADPAVSEWYAGGVRLTLSWAMGGEERPIWV